MQTIFHIPYAVKAKLRALEHAAKTLLMTYSLAITERGTCVPESDGAIGPMIYPSLKTGEEQLRKLKYAMQLGRLDIHKTVPHTVTKFRVEQNQ